MSAESELHQAVKQARRYALEGNYSLASTYYSGLEGELRAYAAKIQHASLRSRWEAIAEQLAAERGVLTELQQELGALVNPADAVRRDRMLSRADDFVPKPEPERPSPYVVRGVRPDAGGPSGGRSNERGGYGGPMLGFGGGGVAPPASSWDEGEDYTAPIRQAVAGRGGRNAGPSTANINEHLYGDKDRFGPSEGPAAPAPIARRTDSSPKVVPSGRPAPAAKTPPARQPATSNQRKPPIPKFGGGGAKRNEGDGQGGHPHPKDGKPKFVPRAGEEELASLIEADMYVGNLNVSFADIAGQVEAKGLLEEAVVYPILMPDYFQGIRRPWKGIMMYGPPGTGKTMLAKAVASECGTTFFNISPATLTSKWRGEGEKLIRVLFDMARHYAPSTIFIDEIDSLCGQRGGGDEHEASRRAKGVLLAQMDGVGVDPGKVVMVLGATNHPWDIDEAMRRRLEKRIYIPLPTLDDRIELFKINTRTVRLAPDVDFERLSRILDDHYYSAADITIIARDAAMMTMRRFMSDEKTKQQLKERGAEIGKLAAEEPITMNDFMSAVRKVPSSINVDQIKKFEDWKKEFEANV